MNTYKKNKTMNEKFRAIKIIHIAMIIGVSLAYFLVGDLQAMDFLNFSEIEISAFVYLVIPFSAVFIGNFLYKKQLTQVGGKLSLEEKMGTYQTASLIRWAVLEGAAFFILFVKKELIIVGLLLILYMALLKPSEHGMKRDFETAGK